MAKVGRRRGNADTRAEILAAARGLFREQGYVRASLRAIARRAGVDPSLVHHYFADKAALFVESMGLPTDPQRVQREATAEGFDGGRVVERFLAQWERGRGPGSPAFVAMVQAMAASPEVADAMREFLAERLGLLGDPGEDESMRRRRRALISSQLLGVGWTRYIMRIEPMASAPREEVARWVGPTIERYATGDPDAP
jgi:AcrR family transcriptional regulator